MNAIQLVGRIGRDAELKYLPSGVAVANFSLAVSGPKGADGERATDWFDVAVWRQQAEKIAGWLVKGRLVAIAGEMRSRKYETQDGQTRTAWTVNASHVEFLDKPKEGGADDDERPF